MNNVSQQQRDNKPSYIIVAAVAVLGFLQWDSNNNLNEKFIKIDEKLVRMDEKFVQMDENSTKLTRNLSN